MIIKTRTWKRGLLLATTLGLLAPALQIGCGSGSGGGSTPGVAAPSNLVYDQSSATYPLGAAIIPNKPASGGGAVTGYTIRPALPAGLALDARTGILAGTPTAELATTVFTITAANAGGTTSATLTLTVLPAPPANLTYAPGSVAYGVGEEAFPNVPSHTGGLPSSYAVQPPLPAGLVLDPHLGILSGTPTVERAATAFTITASNAGGATTATLTLSVRPAAPIALSYAPGSAVYRVGEPASPNIPRNGGGRPSGYAIQPPLPAGLVLDPHLGILSGTPTVELAATAFTITAANLSGSTEATLTLRVLPAEAAPTLSYSTPVPIYTVGQPIVANVPDTGGAPATGFAVQPALPAGLSLDAATGVITGTPTATLAATAFSITASTARGPVAAVLSLTIQVLAPINLEYRLDRPVYLLGQTIDRNAPTCAGGPVEAYAITPPLPPGLAFDALTGALTGTPAALSAASSHTVTATNAAGSAHTTLEVRVLASRQAVFPALFTEVPDSNNGSSRKLDFPGLRRTAQYEFLLLPKAPILHPYNPLDPADGSLRPGRLAAQFTLNLKLPPAFQEVLPAPVRARVAELGLQPDQVDLFCVSQDQPWTGVPMLFRPHYWADPDAPFFGDHSTGFEVRVGILEAESAVTFTELVPPATSYTTGITIHPAAEVGNLVVSSPANMPVSGLNFLHTTSFWTVTQDVTPGGAARAAATLHLLLNDADQATLEGISLAAGNLRQLVTALNDSPLGGTRPVLQLKELTRPLILGAKLLPASAPLEVELLLTGTCFTGATQVTLGPESGRNLRVLNDTTLEVTASLGAGAAHELRVTTPMGVSAAYPFPGF